MHKNKRNPEYKRSEILERDLNNFLTRITEIKKEYTKSMKTEDFILLKNILRNINNIITFKVTISLACWISDFFELTEKETDDLIKRINNQKPNSNGYDIEINNNLKILAEVKSTVPINAGNTFGSAQKNSILNDAIKLKNGNKRIKDTSNYIKIIGILDLGEKTDKAINNLIKPVKNSRSKKREAIERNEIKNDILIIDDSLNKDNIKLDKIYIKKVKIKDDCYRTFKK